MVEKSLLWVYKNVDFSQPRDISKKLEKKHQGKWVYAK